MTSVPTPPLLLAAALLFWGWQTGLLVLGLALALLLEGARFTPRRLELTPADFNRVADLCTLAVLGVGAYLFTVGAGRALPGGPRAITVLFQWLPVPLALLVAAQVYSTAGRVGLTAFFWSLRRRTPHEGEPPFGAVDLTFPYVVLCVLSASAANGRTPGFYLGLCGLAGWALWAQRSRRVAPAVWAGLLALAAGLGWGGQLALHAAQQRLEQTVFEYLVNLVRRDTDPFRATTALGQLGELKLSERILFRVEAGPDVRPPFLLREASYDLYSAPAWFASAADFVAVTPDTDGETWRLRPGAPATAGRRVTVAAYLPGGRGVLALPNRAYRIDRLAVVSLARNRLGAVKVAEGLGLVRYTARFGPPGALDAPPTDTDRHVPVREAPAVFRIADQLGLARRAPAEAVAVLENFFRKEFRYATWQGARPRGTTAVEDFLLRTRAGHCEYYATATVLLLRAAGIPARYAVGYSVQEWSALERRWLVRGRHGHSWALAWVDGSWRDVDTTPPVWNEADAADASWLTPLGDLWSWAVFQFSVWRWSESTHGWASWLIALLGPLSLLLGWRLWRARRVARPAPATPVGPARPPGPGHDSEFYRIEARLAREGFARRAAEPLTAWLGRLPTTAAEAATLGALVRLHYRHRFDPHGLDGGERRALREGVEAWLAAHPSPPGEGRLPSRGGAYPTSGAGR